MDKVPLHSINIDENILRELYAHHPKNDRI